MYVPKLGNTGLFRKLGSNLGGSVQVLQKTIVGAEFSRSILTAASQIFDMVK